MSSISSWALVVLGSIPMLAIAFSAIAEIGIAV